MWLIRIPILLGHRISTFRSNVSSPSSRFETSKNNILALEDEGVIGLSRDVASYPGRTEIRLYHCDNHTRNSQIAHVKKICCRISFRDHILSSGNFAILTTPCVLCVIVMPPEMVL